MSTSHAQRIMIRLFLEGVEVPVIAANIQCAPNSPSVASIQIPPLAEATRLHPRTLVHLFFFDLYEAEAPFVSESGLEGQKPNELNPSAYERQRTQAETGDWTYEGLESLEADRANLRYKLLFVGEIVGFQWTKTPTQRSLVLKCEDLSNYWDYAYQSTGQGLFGPGLKALFSGGSTNLGVDPILGSTAETLTRLLTAGKCNTFPNLSGLAAGVVRIIEAIGGSYVAPAGSKAKRIAGQNLFFSTAELRLRITQMVAAFEEDPTSKRLMQRGGYSSMFSRALGGQGGQTSIRQVLNAVTKIIFYEMYPQPCPLFIPGTAGEVSGTKRTKIKDHPTWGELHTEAENAIAQLEDIKAVVQGSSDTEETDQAALIKQLLARNTAVVRLLRVASRKSFRAPGALQGFFVQSLRQLGVVSARLGAWRPRAPQSVQARVVSALDQAIEPLRRVLNYQVNETSLSETNPARLNQQLFRPDVWFTSPPRCNVIFPEHYNMLSFERMFLQEPTRFLLKTNDEFFGEDAFFDRYYFAPQAGTVRGDKSRLQDLLKGDVLNHELFTGVLPIFEKMGEFNIFASRSVGSDGNVPKVGLAQRSANFLYFKHRFNARKMTVQGRFNPYIAVGFPGLIIDRHVDREVIDRYNEILAATEGSSSEASQILGTNFLGNFTQIQHQVNQGQASGQTMLICSYPRQVEESIEFLGAIPEARVVKKQFEDGALRSTTVAAVNPPRLYTLGPNQGQVTNVQDVTAQYTSTAREDRSAAQKLPLYDLADPSFGRSNPQLVPIGVAVTGSSTSIAKISAIAGGADIPVVFRAYTITEEIPRFRREDVELPAEEFIRPGWYGDIWSPAKVGQVYNNLLAIGSITDPTTIVSPQGAATGQQSEDQLQALADQDRAVDAEDPRVTAPALVALDENSTIQQAVEFLLLTYSYVCMQNVDTEEFIRSYTWRPIATMVDLFGTTDLSFSQDGSSVEAGVEGFHSRAFGPYDDLFGLVSPDIEDILGIKRGAVSAQRADTRKRKLEAVLAYRTAVRFSRALLG